MSDANEVERLRARVAELEAQVTSTEARPPSGRAAGRRSVWWAVSAAILVTLACVLAPLSVVSVWASTQLSDSDAYVDTVAPLADDPAVQSAVAADVTEVVFDNLDVETLTTEALEALAQQENVPPRIADALPGLAVPIANGIESFTRDQVDNILASPQFAELWAQVNRIAHEQVVRLLEGNQGGAVSAQGDTITLNLGPIVDAVKAQLVDRGFDLAADIPTVDRTFVLAQSDVIADGQGVYSLLNTLGFWLPIIALALFVGGVLLARDRRRTTLRGALGVVAALVVLGVGLALIRTWYVGTTPADVLTEEAAGSVFDTIVRFLRTGIRALAVLALIVAVAAFLTGPSTAAVKTRATLERGIGRGAETTGWDTGRVGAWTFSHKTALRITAVIAGGLVLMFWTRPTAWVVVAVALLVVLLLAVFEFLASPTARAAATPTDQSGGAEPTLPRQTPRTPPAEPKETQPAAEETLQRSERT